MALVAVKLTFELEKSVSTAAARNLEDIDAALAPTAEIAVPISEVLIYKKKKKREVSMIILQNVESERVEETG